MHERGAGVADAALRVRKAVASALDDLPADAMVLIGVSGGADSLALARAASQLDRRVAVGIVDHGLQAESAEAAREAARACEALGLHQVIVERVHVDVGRAGPEAAARDARRRALSGMADRVGAVAILLAHTRDDQAETVLLRLSRGSGSRSLAAMAPVSGRWRHPMLDLPRDVVRASVADLAAWDDPHNADRAFARVRVRHVALPALVDSLGPDVVAGLARSARLLRDDADALDALAEAAAVEVTDPQGSLDADALSGLSRAVRTRVIRAAALAQGCPPTALTADHIDRIEALVSRWHGQGAIDLPGGIAAERRYGRLAFIRVAPVAERRRTLEE